MKLASMRGVLMDGSKGNWSNDSMLEFVLLENSMMRSAVPLR